MVIRLHSYLVFIWLLWIFARWAVALLNDAWQDELLPHYWSSILDSFVCYQILRWVFREEFERGLWVCVRELWSAWLERFWN
jgi:hypothetical protein